jgi:hypothetical protein
MCIYVCRCETTRLIYQVLQYCTTENYGTTVLAALQDCALMMTGNIMIPMADGTDSTRHLQCALPVDINDCTGRGSDR